MRFPLLRFKNRCFLPIGPFCCLALGAALAQGAVAENKVLKLDGKGSYVELPPNIFTNLTEATVEVWAKWNSFRSYTRVFEFGAGWQSMSLFNHATTRDLRFNLYPHNAKHDPSSQFTVYARSLLRSNEWIHLAAVSGPRGMKLFANGVLVGHHTNSASFADIKVFQTNYLGRGLARNPTDRDFRGEIDELRVWDHRRTTAQIRGNMFKRLSGTEKGLVHLWNFDDGTANDACPEAQHGKLFGNAEIVASDLGFGTAVAAAAPASPPPAATNNAAASPVNPAPKDAAVVTWWIAGALLAIVGLLAWLVLMLRRSGLGTSRLLPASPLHAALEEGGSSAKRLALPGDGSVAERTQAELAEFAKKSLVQGLYSQRVALLEAQKRAQEELAALEAQLVALHLPERIQAYEKRIAELEAELHTRSDELREWTQATLLVLRQKVEEEKRSEMSTSRFN